MQSIRIATCVAFLVTLLSLPAETGRGQPRSGSEYLQEQEQALSAVERDERPGAGRVAAAEEADRAQVVGRAGTVVVTVGELQDALARADLQDRRRLGAEGLKRKVLDDLLREAVLAEAAQRRGLGEYPEVRVAERAALVRVLHRRDFASDAFADDAGGEWAANEASLEALVARLRHDHLQDLVREPLYRAAFQLPPREVRPAPSDPVAGSQLNLGTTGEVEVMEVESLRGRRGRGPSGLLRLGPRLPPMDEPPPREHNR